MMNLLLALYVASLPFEYLWVHLFGSDTELKPYRVLGMVLAALWVLNRLASRRGIRVDGYDWILIFFSVAGLALAGFWSLVGTGSLSTAVHDTILGAFALVTYFVIKNSDRGNHQTERLLTIYVYAVAFSVVAAYTLGLSTAGERFAALSESSNSLAFSITVALHIVAARLLHGTRETSPVSYFFHASLVLVLLVALLFTGSRGAMVAFLLSLPLHVVVLGQQRSDRARRVRRLAAFATAVLLAGLVVATTLDRYRDRSGSMQRLEQTGVEATSGRYDIWRSAWGASVDYFFVGMGTAQYRSQHAEYIRRLENVYDRRLIDKNLGTHSDYFEILTSYGIIGLVLYIGMLLSLFRRLLLRARSQPVNSTWSYAVLPPLVALVAVSGISHVFIRSPHFFFLLAIMTGTLLPRRATAQSGRRKVGKPHQLSALEIARRIPRPLH